MCGGGASKVDWEAWEGFSLPIYLSPPPRAVTEVKVIVVWGGVGWGGMGRETSLSNSNHGALPIRFYCCWNSMEYLKHTFIGLSLGSSG